MMMFQTASQMELLVQWQEEVERGEKGLKDGECYLKMGNDKYGYASGSLGAPSALFFFSLVGASGKASRVNDRRPWAI